MSKPELLVAAFADLFEGRGDAYGTNDGGCVRRPVTSRTFARHLSGVEPIGIYPLKDGQVKWGCSDLDMPKMGMDPTDSVMARNLHKVLDVLGIRSWIERSKSKGFHVFVFSTEWLPAEHMRNCLLYAHQIAGVPPTEINPKQTGGVELGNYLRTPYAGSLSKLDQGEPGLVGRSDRRRGVLVLEEGQSQRREGRPGAFRGDERPGRTGDGASGGGGGDAPTGKAPEEYQVRTVREFPVAGSAYCGRCGADVRPLPVDARTSSGQDSGPPRQVVLDARTLEPLCLRCFLPSALTTRNTPAQIKRVAAMYVPPPPKRTEHRRVAPTGGIEALTTHMSGLTVTVFRNGPNPGHDRSTELGRLAHLLREDDFSYSDAFELLADADARWGKFYDRADGEAQLRRILDGAY